MRIYVRKMFPHDAGGKAHTRKLYNDDVNKRTGKVKYQSRMVDIEYHY